MPRARRLAIAAGLAALVGAGGAEAAEPCEHRCSSSQDASLGASPICPGKACASDASSRSRAGGHWAD